MKSINAFDLFSLYFAIIHYFLDYLAKLIMLAFYKIRNLVPKFDGINLRGMNRMSFSGIILYVTEYSGRFILGNLYLKASHFWQYSQSMTFSNEVHSILLFFYNKHIYYPFTFLKWNDYDFFTGCEYPQLLYCSVVFWYFYLSRAQEINRQISFTWSLFVLHSFQLNYELYSNSI